MNPLQLTTPACPVREKLQSECRDAVEAIGWVRNTAISVTSRKVASQAQFVKGLKNVSHVIAVASCKGCFKCG